MARGAGPDAVRWLREVCGLTQRALATQSGVSERTIRGLERGTVRNPHLASLEALTKAARLTDTQAAAFVRAWSPDRTRSLTDLSQQVASFDEVVAETILQSEIEENLIASWVRFRIQHDQLRVLEADAVLEAQRDGVDTYVVPYRARRGTPTPDVTTTRTSGCSLRQIHEFAGGELLVFELAFPRPLRAGETAAFRFSFTHQVLDRETYHHRTHRKDAAFVRMQHRRVPLTVVEVAFETSPPPLVWEVEAANLTDGTHHPVRTIVPSTSGRVHLIRRHARPGSFGFKWPFDPSQTHYPHDGDRRHDVR